MTKPRPEPAPTAQADDVDDALALLFAGRVDKLLPPEELEEFHHFLREEALRKRRFALSFRVECGCLAWIGFKLAKIVTSEDGIEYTATPMQTFVPDHEPDTEHPEGPNEDPPADFADWPIWPYEIYQDEMEAAEAQPAFPEEVKEALDAMHIDRNKELESLLNVAAQEDPLVDRD